MTEGEKGSFVTRLAIDYSEIMVKISLLCERLKAQGEELENFGNRLALERRLMLVSES